MQSNLNHSVTITDGEHYEINGLNIWDYAWEQTGQRLEIKDPIYSQSYSFNIYEINNHNITARFAAGEYSNNVWGIFHEY